MVKRQYWPRFVKLAIHQQENMARLSQIKLLEAQEEFFPLNDDEVNYDADIDEAEEDEVQFSSDHKNPLLFLEPLHKSTNKRKRNKESEDIPAKNSKKFLNFKNPDHELIHTEHNTRLR
jgi:hypothetical protein